MVESLPEAELDHILVNLAELSERRQHTSRVRFAIEYVGDSFSMVSLDRFNCESRKGAKSTGCRPRVAPQGHSRDSEQPWQRRAVVMPRSRATPPRFQEDGRHEVFGLLAAVKAARQVAIDRVAVAVVYHTERFSVALRYYSSPQGVVCGLHVRILVGGSGPVGWSRSHVD